MRRYNVKAFNHNHKKTKVFVVQAENPSDADERARKRVNWPIEEIQIEPKKPTVNTQF